MAEGQKHDWLSFVTISGLVVSEAVLRRRFPDGPEAAPARVASHLATEWERFRLREGEGHSQWLDFVLETLLEIARLSDVGIEIDVSRVPMPDVVRRFSRAFEFDPLRMISSGTLAVTIPPEETAEAGLALKKIGIDYAEVGVVTGGVGVTLVRGIASANYSEIRCEEDELARLWALHRPRD